MNLESLIKLIRSFGAEAESERRLLTECLEGLVERLDAKNKPGLADFKTRNSLKAYADELESG